MIQPTHWPPNTGNVHRLDQIPARLGQQVLALTPTTVGVDGTRHSALKMLQKHKTILVVDDEASQRRFMSRVLEDAGYNVLEGGDYDEALVIYNQYQGKIDLLITDVSLPGTNGYVLARALLDLEPGVTVIFISGLVGAELCRYHGMATTDIHFLEKPFNGTALLRRVRQVLQLGGPYLTRTA